MKGVESKAMKEVLASMQPRDEDPVESHIHFKNVSSNCKNVTRNPRFVESSVAFITGDPLDSRYLWRHTSPEPPLPGTTQPPLTMSLYLFKDLDPGQRCDTDRTTKKTEFPDFS
ncbi:hypothetical protein TNIN_58711 [Trichonephila inaurata madagascariensis]|uniref:Uncharacterized protein n=1 Tax=Trichonephila inaurata madagascariensis TaxID=2747483 RepID=A0A8X6XEX6_9ARAC|nr:hypothetical protein TNIN_58711 [Trichonephila inaurata madagascariensis]